MLGVLEAGSEHILADSEGSGGGDVGREICEQQTNFFPLQSTFGGTFILILFLFCLQK